MEKIASLILAAGFALPAAASETGPGAADAGPELRSLAEIDGDPETLTEDERAKMALLRQVLGTAPVAPRDRVAEAAEVNGALDGAAPGP